MADSKHTGACSAAAPTDFACPDECALRVIIRPLRLDFWEFEGTRAELEGEGVIPPDTDWPEGAQGHRWEAGRFQYWLRRIRPEGLKGPMKLWTSGDWWCLRCHLIGGPGVAARRILDKRRELAAEIYRQSPAWERAWQTEYARSVAAEKDKAFQAFKTLIPGLVPPPRVRRLRAGPPAP